MSVGDECAWCNRSDQPPAIQPFLFYSRAGKPLHRWLHPAPCLSEAHARYREKRAEWDAEAAGGRDGR